ncbi:replication initiation factor domain-containing protein [Lacticaseibacillus saniviri]
MTDKRLILSVDEFTLVIKVKKIIDTSMGMWAALAEQTILEFSQKAKFSEIFGDSNKLDRPSQGYTVGITFGTNPFYFALAYHPDALQMGIVCKYSAHAWAVYIDRWQKQFKEEMNLAYFLNIVSDDHYDLRLSRVDLTADYMNYGLDINAMYESLLPDNQTVKVINSKGRQSVSKLTAFAKDGKVTTFYVGSKKANSRSFMRVYDKKQEQEETFGFRMKQAEELDDWTRMEAVYKGAYAHQLTEIIQNEVHSSNELTRLIADKILEKFQFVSFQEDKPTEPTVALTRVQDGQFPILHLESPRDNDLQRSVEYLMQGSGLFQVMHKIEGIWGRGMGKTFLLTLYQYYLDNSTPNNDTGIWMSKHLHLMQRQDFMDLFPYFVDINNENAKNAITQPASKE